MKTIDTERLLIRIDSEEDYKKTFESYPDEELKVFFGLDDAALEIQRLKLAGGLTTYRTSVVFFHLQEKQSGKVIGNFAFHNWYALHRRSEIGYALYDTASRNRGFMKEAFPAIMAYGFDTLNLNRMEAFIDPENAASRKLVERAGFRQEGLLKDHYCQNGVIGDSVLYGLLAKEYYQAKMASA